jgi:hypothetical protein
MAVRFYQVGDAGDLASQLITVLRSTELQRSMAQQNFAAGLEMTIGKVVRNYLRWFELNKCKKALANSPGYQEAWPGPVLAQKSGATDFRSPAEAENGIDIHGHESAARSPQPIDFVDPLV